MVDFGKKIKKLRKQVNLSQKQLADRIGVSDSTISYYETSVRYPSPDMLITFAKYFHVTTDYLLGLDHVKILNVSDMNEEEIKLLQYIIDTLKNNRK